MSNFKRWSLLSVAACGLMTATAVAQSTDYYSRDKYEAVTDRRQPEFDPEPVRLGAFEVRSNAEFGLASTSNAFAASSNEQSDIIGRIGGEVEARTNWSVHQVGVDLSAYHDEYFDNGTQSNDDLRARLLGRLDVTRELSLGGNVFAQQRQEPQTEVVNAVGLESPIEYTRVGGYLDVNYMNDRVRWTNSVGTVDENFKDGRLAGVGTPVNQDFRDRSIMEARSRLSYAVSPNLAVYAQGTATQADYDSTQFIAGGERSRDSKGYIAAAGVDFELTSLVRGDIAVGYMNDKKDDPFFKDTDGLSVDGIVQWFPSRLTTVTASAGRRVVDAGLFAAPSALQTTFGARIDHELKRNIILSAFGDTNTRDFQEVDRKDEILNLGVGATYKMNKRVHFEAFARRLNRDVSGVDVFGDPSYDINLFGVGLKLYP